MRLYFIKYFPKLAGKKLSNSLSRVTGIFPNFPGKIGKISFGKQRSLIHCIFVYYFSLNFLRKETHESAPTQKCKKTRKRLHHRWRLSFYYCSPNFFDNKNAFQQSYLLFFGINLFIITKQRSTATTT